MGTRIVVGLLALAVVLPIVVYGGFWGLSAMMTVVAAFSIYEFAGLIRPPLDGYSSTPPGGRWDVLGFELVAGLGLYWVTSGGLSLVWVTSGPGLGFTLGSLAALAAFGIGFFGIRPRAERIGALGAAIGAAGGPPTPEQGAEMGRLDAEIHGYERWDVSLLVLSLALMATARYWSF